jgi:hypothetical protein
MSGSDGSFERLLSGALKGRDAAASGNGCLDAETLAAWADGTLAARERADAEAHAADCGRCQALLAAMVRTEPPAVVSKWSWRLPALSWLVPVTVAVTALVVWVAVPNRAPVQRSDDGVAAVDKVEPLTPTPRAAPPAEAKAEARNEATGDPTAQRFTAPAPTAPPAPVEARERQEAALEKQPTPAAAESANAIAAKANAGAAAPAAADAASGIASTSAPARTMAFGTALDVIVVSSNPSTRFRLLPGGGVQRTADAGSTWRTEVTGATQTLTAGSSPSPSVCWLVGPSGTVLLSSDGRSWRLLAFPERVDLRSVTAADNENATVTTADGRSFVTADGGRTWARTPDP